jgi:hypothetical protein
MNEITDIYKLSYMSGAFSYAGTLRNEKKFNIGDKVYFAFSGNKIAYGFICGVELPPEQNPDYIYKIQISDWLLYNECNKEVVDFMHSKEIGLLENVVLKCDRIFSTIDEARTSAVKNLELIYKLEKSAIDIYFNQFNK